MNKTPCSQQNAATPDTLSSPDRREALRASSALLLCAGIGIGKSAFADTARTLIAATLRGNAEVLLREDRPLGEIAGAVATPGGISEMLLATLADRGALAAWDEGLDRVLKRIGG